MFGALLFFSGIAFPLPYVNAEQRNGEIASTMYATGDMLVPRLEGVPHLTKPPLFHWLSYAVSCVRGEGGLGSARFVSAAAGVATLWLTYLLGTSLLGPATAWYGTCLLLSTIMLFVHHGHRGTFDTTLTAFLCLALYGYVSQNGPRPVRARILLVIGLTGGFLVKGPIAWILPSVPMVVDSLSERGRRRTLRGALFLTAGVLALSFPWYVISVLRVPEARQVFIDAVRVNFGGRSQVYEMAFHREPLYFYLWQFPLLLLPWALFLPVLRRGFIRQPSPQTGRSARLLAHYVLWSLLFLSLVPAKSSRYLVPLAPAVALLLGHWFATHRAAAPGELPWLTRLWRVGTGLLLMAAIGLPAWLWARLGEPLPVLVATASILALAAGYAWYCRRQVTVPLFLAMPLVLAMLFVPLAYQRWVPRQHYVHEAKNSPEQQAYKYRVARLSRLFGKAK